jgi:hypothetical protein
MLSVQLVLLPFPSNHALAQAPATTLLGNQSIAPLDDSNNAGRAQAFVYTAPASGVSNELRVYINGNSTATRVVVGVYANGANNNPSTLLGQATITNPTRGAWNTVTLPNISVTAGTNYWIAILGPSGAGVVHFRVASSGAGSKGSSQTNLSSLPATWSTNGNWTTSNASAYLVQTSAPDSTPPTVSITAPADQTTVSGTVNIVANASDTQAMGGVQFKVDGVNLGAEDTSAPYSVSWNTANLLDGPKVLTAVARDAAGNTTTSASVTVNTANPSKLTITQPTSGASMSGNTVNVIYTKAGEALPGYHAHFRLDGGPTVMDIDYDGSYTFTNVPAGPHTLEGVVANASHVEFAGSGSTVSFTTVVPDTQNPTVDVTAPANGATVSGTINVTANASDNVGVAGVQFLLDGANLGTEDTTAPYSVSFNTTTVANGPHVLAARARDTSSNSATSASVNITVANGGGAEQVGQWGTLMNWPLVAVHATQLYTGEILMWDAWESPVSNAKLWNPTTNTFTDRPVTSALFCSAHASIATGEVVVMGGHAGSEIGIKDINVFNPDTRAWTKKVDMQYARWYPSVNTTGDGRVLVISGEEADNGYIDHPEIFDPKTNTVTALSTINTTQMREEQYPQTMLLPSGKFVSISGEHGGVQILDINAPSWTNVGTSPAPYGVRTSFAPGKFLIAGGGTYNGPSQKTAKILDLTSGSPVWSDAGTMNVGRSYNNVIMLPDGKAMAVGGSNTVSEYSTSGTLTNEIWDPATNTWTLVASAARARMYHSIAMVLPDGRVLTAGGGRLAPAPDQPNAQIYSPPYLFKGARPTINSAPATSGYNTVIDVGSPDAASIAKVTLLDLASTTHTHDSNQVFMELPFALAGGTLRVTTPPNSNYAPEGYYMLFIVNSAGVPSVAKILRLGQPDTTPPAISNINVTNNNGTSIQVNFTTNEPSDTRVEYGLDTNYGSFTTLDPTPVNNHSQIITGLTVNTPYHYRVITKDSSGNSTTSGDQTVTTAAAPPQNLMGNDQIQSFVDTNSPGVAQAFLYTAAATGVGNRIAVYLDSGNAATRVEVGIYSNSASNNPQTLLAKATVTNPTNGAWNTATLPNVNITAGTQYWIAILGPTGTGAVRFRDATTGAGSRGSQANLSTLPATWTSNANWANSALSAYVLQ